MLKDQIENIRTQSRITLQKRTAIIKAAFKVIK